MYKLNVVLPGFMKIPDSGGAGVSAWSKYAAINRVSSRCRRYENVITGYEAVLCEQFGVYKDALGCLPLGAIRLLGIDGQSIDENCLCADPVSLHAGQREVILQDTHDLAMSADEAQQLAQLFNQYYSDEGLQLTADTTMQWHLHCNSTEPISLPPLNEVVNRKINSDLLVADQPRYWRNILNEVQMLFHNAELNRIREAKSLPKINGLWLYGPGKLPQEVSCKWSNVLADDPLAVGLARLAGASHTSIPESFDSLSVRDKSAMCMVSIKTLQRALLTDNYNVWIATTEWLDRQWFAPALKALANGNLKELIVHDCTGHRYEIRRADLWRFWRRSASILKTSD